ncbi:DUF1831 domain-containing protein [Ligilactobacillus sp. WILCCON 0076]|uniref:DUF1831 domain-containing protein n=1 Tax=Ligilactobacillus ubinensis TaxID=2876789 RepID=A0A9X2JKV8_9LACO|nr:DUF1831 domain-containing protein [Ligilactobacillus ubinensis]MCP0886482.1 DUF1831 domain-containing protein [Ligilactobacillus ubinensis]
MAYTKAAKVLGMNQVYKLADNIKRYSLRDVGFIESKNGKFQLERSLDPRMPINQSFKFKMVVQNDLHNFKMATVTANGLKEVNIFKANDAEKKITQLEYIIKDLQEHNILVIEEK